MEWSKKKIQIGVEENSRGSRRERERRREGAKKGTGGKVGMGERET